MRATLLALLFLMAASLVGCGAQASTNQAPVDTSEVTMPPSYLFSPAAIRVPAGTTVTWRNADHFSHSVRVSGEGFPYLNLAPGQSGTITFSQPGEYAYICTYHVQDMKGTVVVIAR